MPLPFFWVRRRTQRRLRRRAAFRRLSLQSLVLAGLAVLSLALVWAGEQTLVWGWGRIPEPVDWLLDWEAAYGQALEPLPDTYGEKAPPTQRVSRIGRAVAARMPQTLPFEPRFLVLKTDEANAYSFPGGLIAVTWPALQLFTDDRDLAAILAHELAHFYYRDAFWSLFGRILLAFTPLSAGGGLDPLSLGLSHHGRARELRADQFAAQTLADLGLNPGRVLDALERLHEAAPDWLAWIPGPFSSHPSLEERRAFLSPWLGARENEAPFP